MIRQLTQFNVSRSPPIGSVNFALAKSAPGPVFRGGGAAASGSTSRFPRRPDADVLSNSISLFFVGQNKHGFWFAREAEGRSGGLFLLKRSAVRFANKTHESAGCATMFLAEPFELDVENQGNHLLAQIGAAADGVARRAPGIADFIGSVVAEWRKLVTQISDACASQRRHREAIERDLFRGQYTLCSKNDDDLPIP
jgi:hypothetical protein